MYLKIYVFSSFVCVYEKVQFLVDVSLYLQDLQLVLVQESAQQWGIRDFARLMKSLETKKECYFGKVPYWMEIL